MLPITYSHVIHTEIKFCNKLISLKTLLIDLSYASPNPDPRLQATPDLLPVVFLF